jgi:hypothetical protein
VLLSRASLATMSLSIALLPVMMTTLQSLSLPSSPFGGTYKTRVPPEDNATASEKAEALAKTILIDDMRSVDMSTTNSWVVLAQEWLETIEPAKINEDKAKEIKALVPDDAAEAFGSGIIVRRDRRGRLSLRKEKET